MPPVTSAGLLVFRRRPQPVGLQVLLAHPGGPLWRRKDAGAWSLPKGEYVAGEDPLAAARREFEEEVGQPAPTGPFLPLGTVRQAGGKRVTAWATEGDLDPELAVSTTVEIEWPPRSGRRIEIPEVDRVAWFDPPAAAGKLNAGQVPLLTRLIEALTTPGGTPPDRPIT